MKFQIDPNAKGRDCFNATHWRNSILERDNHTCQKCSSVKSLRVHHIKSWDEYPELRFEISNGLTLCNSCHMRLHGKIHGFKKGCIPWTAGKHHSPETRMKISESNIGKKHSQETIQRLSDAKRGHKHSEETKQKMRTPRPWTEGRTMSLKQRKQISNTIKRRFVSEETRKKLSEIQKDKYRSGDHPFCEKNRNT